MTDRIDPASRVYADALYAAATDAGRVSQVDRDLAAFLGAMSDNVLLLRALVNPQLPREAKCRIIGKLMDGSEPLARHAMLVLVDNGRVSLLQDVQLAYAELAAVEEQIVDVEVTTAVPLDDAQVTALEQRITAGIGQTARLTVNVDPRIIGGLVLRARGVLLDASVKRRLSELRRALVNTPLPIGSEA